MKLRRLTILVAGLSVALSCTSDGTDDPGPGSDCAAGETADCTCENGGTGDRFAPGLHGFAARMMGKGSPAIDDIVQATFLQVYRSAPAFRGKSSVRAWLFGVAANLIRDHFRAEARRSEVLSEVARQPVRARTSPIEAIEHIERQRRLTAAIEQLPPALKEAYVLCVVEELLPARTRRERWGFEPEHCGGDCTMPARCFDA